MCTHTQCYSLSADGQHMGNWNLLMAGSWFSQAFIYYFCICLFITVPWNISLGYCLFVWRDHNLSRCDNVSPVMFSDASSWGLHAVKIIKATWTTVGVGKVCGGTSHVLPLKVNYLKQEAVDYSKQEDSSYRPNRRRHTWHPQTGSALPL